MTEFVGSVTARQIHEPHEALMRVVADVLVKREFGGTRGDTATAEQDLLRVLSAVNDLSQVIRQHVRPRCPNVMPDTEAWRCGKPEGHKDRHGDGLMSW